MEGEVTARFTNIALNLLSLALMGAGVILISTFFLPASYLNHGPSGKAAQAKPRGFEVPVLANEQEPVEPAERPSEVPKSSSAQDPKPDKDRTSSEVPEEKTLTLTIPKMDRVKQAAIPTSVGTDEEKLRNHAAIHLKGTGYPWERGSNVYIAGHRLGYPATKSFLAFYDLNKLEAGDRVLIRDAKDRRYAYRVFRVLVVDPTDLFVTEPLKGRDIVTLQTCTLPDYSQRLIVQAEKVS